MKIILSLLLAVFLATIITNPVLAGKPKTCSLKNEIPLTSYFDGDTPITTAYADYLEDLQWYINEFGITCTVIPETYKVKNINGKKFAVLYGVAYKIK